MRFKLFLTLNYLPFLNIFFKSLNKINITFLQENSNNKIQLYRLVLSFSHSPSTTTSKGFIKTSDTLNGCVTLIIRFDTI